MISEASALFLLHIFMIGVAIANQESTKCDCNDRRKMGLSSNQLPYSSQMSGVRLHSEFVFNNFVAQTCALVVVS